MPKTFTEFLNEINEAKEIDQNISRLSKIREMGLITTVKAIVRSKGNMRYQIGDIKGAKFVKFDDGNAIIDVYSDDDKQPSATLSIGVSGDKYTASIL